MSGEHYFSPEPSSPLTTRVKAISLRGRTISVFTASGTFSPDGIDRGTEVLLKYAPPAPAEGTFLDIGCGWGPITLALALESPGAQVWGVDVNERALATARANCEHLGIPNVRVSTPEEVPTDLTFDLVWSNPPIRVGKAELHAILERWLPRLSPGGEAWLVVAKKLGADSLQEWINNSLSGSFRCERAATAAGFRVLRVRRT